VGSSEGGTASADQANLARLYDYALGGKDNFAVDRDLYERLEAVYPEYRAFAVANRRFLVHAVRRMTAAGVRQFLEVGSGLPTEPNVHATARETVPDATVVYLDRDPVAVAHCRARLGGAPGVHAVQHDLRDVREVLEDPVVRGALDLDEPVGLLCVAVLHFIEHDEARRVLAAYREALAPGSWIALSTHVQDPARDRPALHAEAAGIADALGTRIVARSDREVEELLDGFAVVAPGVVDLAHWRPRGRPETRLWWASAVGRLDGPR
jgi:O-methyltransferase involved in polyketide biosynthesis